MPTYAIGDIQGCYKPLRELLNKLHFNPDKDKLWFAGDLVNRGPHSLKTLQFIHSLRDNVVCVLGNHDLHLLAVAYGYRDHNGKDSFDDVLGSREADKLIDWLRHRPLLHHDKKNEFTLVHAGLPPQWNLKAARACAKEMKKILRGDDIEGFLANMYGNKPDIWSESLSGWERLRFITNSFTRLRYCDHQGRQDFRYNREIGSQPAHLLPWFRVPGRKTRRNKIIFGHWASLGLHMEKNIYALDSGCVWGGHLSAVKLGKSLKITQVSCR